MVRNALAHVVVIVGLLAPAASYAANSNSPYDTPGANPAQSNCDSKTGCANYSTGNRTKARPMHSTTRSRADENRITAELNRQQLAGAK